MKVKNNHALAFDTSFAAALYRDAFLSASIVDPSVGYPECDDCYGLPTPGDSSTISSIHIICDLPGYALNKTIECCITKDNDGTYLADCPQLNIFSMGECIDEAKHNLRNNIVSLYLELNDGSVYSQDWLPIKEFLNSALSPIPGCHYDRSE